MMSKVITSFLITEELLAAFDKAAQAEGLDRSKVLRRLVEAYLAGDSQFAGFSDQGLATAKAS